MFLVFQIINVSQACSPLQIAGVQFDVQWLSQIPGLPFNYSKGQVFYDICRNVSVTCIDRRTEKPHRNQSQLILFDNQTADCTTFQLLQANFQNPDNYSKGVKMTYGNRQKLSPLQPNLTVFFHCDYNASYFLWENQTIISLHYNSKSGCPAGFLGYISDLVWAQNLLAGIAIFITGSIFLLFGVKLYRCTLFLIGLWTAWILYGVLIDMAAEDTEVTLVFWISFGMSIFSGILTFTFPMAGRYLIGSWLGMLITLLLNNMFIYLISSSFIPLIIVGFLLSVVFGLLCVKMNRTFIILSTAFIGSYMMIRPISWYLGNFPNETQINRMYYLNASQGIPFKFWFYVLAIILIAFNGVLFQNWYHQKLGGKTDLQALLDDQQKQLRTRNMKTLFVGQSEAEDSQIQQPFVRKSEDDQHRMSFVSYDG